MEKKLIIFSQRRQGAKITNIFDAFLCELCASARDKLNEVSHERQLLAVSVQSDRQSNLKKENIEPGMNAVIL
ncbi:hypothetical protein D1AOALGA4SA_12794 [Olavius algarvensis Delta 1 endosymbiont]|nr:hypothetical protein D1AOALGA4SA_12794 [Olavius algarvensis Delta 1 endosymbiont]